MKKVILIASFGTTYHDALQRDIKSVENNIKNKFPEYEVRRAFTSRIVLKKLAQRDGILIDNEKQALERLHAEGYQEVFIQPLHVVAGEEYEKLRRLVIRHAHEKTFAKIGIGRPLLYYMGQEDKPDDYLIALEALATQVPVAKEEQAVVFMGHGGVHPGNAAYAALQLKMEQAGLGHMFIYTVEGFPELDWVIEKLKAAKVQKVILMPFMLVAGDHANNDMAGDDEDSAKSQLELAGFDVTVHLQGLGAIPAVQEIYVQHLKEAMIQSAEYRGHKHCN